MVKFAIILFIALALESVGVVFLSKGVKMIGELQGYNPAEIWRVVRHGLANGHFWIGLLFETIFFVLLLVLLSRYDVSLVWPMTALGFIFTVFSAMILGGEHVSVLRWTGVILIVTGAMIVGFTEQKKPQPTDPPTEISR
jgi:drug/metabolite transporter (DMT)-like permease